MSLRWYVITSSRHFNITSSLHYVITVIRHYVNTSLRHRVISPLRHNVNTSLRHYVNTSLRHYVITSLLHYVNTSLRHYAMHISKPTTHVYIYTYIYIYIMIDWEPTKYTMWNVYSHLKPSYSSGTSLHGWLSTEFMIFITIDTNIFLIWRTCLLFKIKWIISVNCIWFK